MESPDRRRFLHWLGGAALAAAAMRRGHAAPEGRKPNVILFYADDLGIGDLGCYGCKDIKTPHLDALAASGARLTNYYSAAPVCSPSRAALLTGLSPQRAGVPTNVRAGKDVVGLPGDRVTIAELLKQQGYATALFGKWHLGTAPESLPTGQGFDEYFGHHYGCISYSTHIFSWDPKLGPVHDLWRNGREVHEDSQYMTDLISRETLRFIGEKKDKPFFLYVAYNAPHYPMEAPKKWMDMYAGMEPNRQPYAAMVSCMDESIGKVVAKVRELGLLDDTLFIFASDNGPSDEARTKVNPEGPRPGSSGPFRGSKFSLLEGGIRMPCIASWKGHIEPGTVSDEPAIAMDVLPTVADVTGAKYPTGLEGRSLWAVLNGGKSRHEALFWESSGQWAARRGEWKLYVPPTGSPQLYNLKDDPGEARDLALDKPDLVKELLALHDQWRATWRR
jgi:arylsulfatase A-like enzyme